MVAALGLLVLSRVYVVVVVVGGGGLVGLVAAAAAVVAFAAFVDVAIAAAMKVDPV